MRFIPTVQHIDRDAPRVRLGRALQRAWRHHAMIAPLYRALAPRMANEVREILLLQLAEREEQHLQMYAARLARMRLPVPKNAGAFASVWRWLLLNCGVRVALAWADWIERRDSALIALVIRQIATRRARGTRT
jgi:hypothetical protein